MATSKEPPAGETCGQPCGPVPKLIKHVYPHRGHGNRPPLPSPFCLLPNLILGLFSPKTKRRGSTSRRIVPELSRCCGIDGASVNQVFDGTQQQLKQVCVKDLPQHQKGAYGGPTRRETKQVRTIQFQTVTKEAPSNLQTACVLWIPVRNQSTNWPHCLPSSKSPPKWVKGKQTPFLTLITHRNRQNNDPSQSVHLLEKSHETWRSVSASSALAIATSLPRGQRPNLGAKLGPL